MSSSITIVIPHFGPWPFWTPFFLLSCEANPSITWLLIGDQLPNPVPKNVECQHASFQEYITRISNALNIRFSPENAYKLCDIRPALGLIHKKELKNSDWWGFGDHDVIYGNLRHFLPGDMLRKHWLISSHGAHVSGHLTLIRNTPAMASAFKKSFRWRRAFENPEYQIFDEIEFTKHIYGHRRLPMWAIQMQRWMDPVKRHSLFIERYSTILAPYPWLDGSSFLNHPTEWIWENGHLTNSRDTGREFMYLHFMNFKSNRYLPDNYGPAAWQGRTDIVQITPESAKKNGFRITPVGFEPINHLSPTPS